VERAYAQISGTDALAVYWQIFMLLAVESEFYGWRGPETDHLLRYCEERGGLKAGQLAARRQSIDPHYTWGYYRAAIDRGETDKVLAGLYGFLAHNADREVLSFAEASKLVPTRADNAANLAQYRRSCWNWGPPFREQADEPLTSPCGVALQWLRSILLYEETGALGEPNGTLSLLPHAPRRWFADGRQVAVRGAPTFYGKLDFQTDAHLARGEIRAQFTAQWQEKPQAVRWRLRHPQDKPIRTVTVNGQSHSRFDAEWVYLPGDTTRADIVVRY
jgi:hypothetical protein